MIRVLPQDDSDSYAIQALARGEATEAQQLQAFKCIVEEICGTYEMTFDPESERKTAFNEGSRHVGRVLVGIVKMNLGKLKEAEKRNLRLKQKGKNYG